MSKRGAKDTLNLSQPELPHMSGTRFPVSRSRTGDPDNIKHSDSTRRRPAVRISIKFEEKNWPLLWSAMRIIRGGQNIVPSVRRVPKPARQLQESNAPKGRSLIANQKTIDPTEFLMTPADAAKQAGSFPGYIRNKADRLDWLNGKKK